MRVEDVLALRPDHAIALIRRMSLGPKPELLLLTELAIYPEPAISVAAIGALDQLEKETLLARGLRHEILSNWALFDRKATVALLKTNPDALGLAIVASFAYEGHVRESAVRNLARRRDCAGLPFLLLRTGDWVREVRDQAAEGALAQMPRTPNEQLSVAFSAFQTLAAESVWRESWVAKRYLAELTSRVGLVAAMRKQATGKQLRYLFTQHIAGPDESWASILKEALEHRDPSLVNPVLRQIALLSCQEQTLFLDDLARSPVPSARALAIEIADRSDRVSLLEDSVHDRNWRVRNDARFFLEKRGRKVLAKEYQERFPAPEAVAGFGEVAMEGDLQTLIPLISDPSPRVRRESIRALGKRGIRSAVPQIKTRLGDSSPRVIRKCIEALRLLRVGVSQIELKSLLTDLTRTTPARRATEDALDLLPRWERLIMVLELTPLGVLAGTPSEHLAKWSMARSTDYAGPNLDQLGRATKALGGC